MFEQSIPKQEKPSLDEFLKGKEEQLKAIQERMQAKLDEIGENVQKLLEITAGGDSEKASAAIKLMEKHKKLNEELDAIQDESEELGNSIEEGGRDYI